MDLLQIEEKILLTCLQYSLLVYYSNGADKTSVDHCSRINQVFVNSVFSYCLFLPVGWQTCYNV